MAVLGTGTSNGGCSLLHAADWVMVRPLLLTYR